MKRYVFFTILTLCYIMTFAGSPKLASEKIFEDIDLYDPSLSITMMKQKNQTVRTLSFKNKPELFKKIKKALDTDKEHATSKSFVSDNGEISESIVIINDEDEIKIGLNNSRSKEVYFFMQVIHKNPSNVVRSSSKASKTSTKKSTKSKRTSKAEKKGKKNKSTKRLQPLLEENLLTNDTIVETSVIYLLSDL